jgi:hypothetical protein
LIALGGNDRDVLGVEVVAPDRTRERRLAWYRQ